VSFYLFTTTNEHTCRSELVSVLLNKIDIHVSVGLEYLKVF
jgi:hypothetical protein